MKNKKGQALVEFAILLPLFLFMLLASLDIGKILYTQSNLENQTEHIIDTYNKEKNMEELKTDLLEKEKINLTITTEFQYTTFRLQKKIQTVTPGLNLIFKDPFYVTVDRVIYNE